MDIASGIFLSMEILDVESPFKSSSVQPSTLHDAGLAGNFSGTSTSVGIPLRRSLHYTDTKTAFHHRARHDRPSIT